MILRPRPLTPEAFRPFGEVIACSSARQRYPINDGTAERYHDLADLDLAAEGGRAMVSIFRATPRELPLAIALMERHPLSSQAFMPLHDHGFLVVVAPAGPAPGVAALICFRAGPGQGVNIARGVWHHPLIALGRTADFLVIDRGGPGANCDEVRYPSPGQAVVPA